jgi:hypothetical protein
LESEVGLEVLSDFSDETLERQLADQELSRLLVTTDFTKSDCTGAVTMRLLDASGSVVQASDTYSCSKKCEDAYVGADFLAALEASCLRGALPPVDLRAVCLVRAIEIDVWSDKKCDSCAADVGASAMWLPQMFILGVGCASDQQNKQNKYLGRRASARIPSLDLFRWSRTELIKCVCENILIRARRLPRRKTTTKLFPPDNFLKNIIRVFAIREIKSRFQFKPRALC